MTIEEAIEIYEKRAKSIERSYARGAWADGGHKTSLMAVAADHRQLAEWLKELKELKNSVGAVKLSNMKEALALIRTLKAELNGWKEDPFGIIAEVCGAATDCKRCQWYEKCPCYPEEWYPEKWRTENV